MDWEALVAAQQGQPLLPPVWGGRPSLFRDIDEQRVARDIRDNNADTPYIRQVMSAITRTMGLYGRYGTIDENGLISARNTDRSNIIESAGAYSRDMTPFFFQSPDIPKLRQRAEQEPDLSWQDWMSQGVMTDISETYDEWDFNAQFVLMKENGQVKFSGPFVGQNNSVTNDEYGSGIKIKWTWFETNRFDIKMQTLAPKFKFAWFDQIADQAYAGLIAAAVALPSATGQRVIRDLNLWYSTVQRVVNYNNKYKFSGLPLRIIAPPEAWWFLSQAFRLTENPAPGAREVMQSRPSVTFTNKIPAPAANAVTIYLVVDKWEQNFLGTRVPLSAYGPQQDIVSFADLLTYRGAYGMTFDATSIYKITFDTTHANFTVGGPVETHAVP